MVRAWRTFGTFVLLSVLTLLVGFSVVSCSPKFQSAQRVSEKITVAAVVKLPDGAMRPAAQDNPRTGVNPLAFVDEIAKFKLTVLNAAGNVVHTGETSQKSNVVFRVELPSAGNYTFRVEGLDSSNNVILSGQSTAEVQAGRSNDLTIVTEFVDGTLEVTVEVNSEVWALYSVSSARFNFRRSDQQAGVEQTLTPNEALFSVQRSLKPAIYDVTTTLTFQRRNENVQPAEVTVNRTFSQEVRPAKTSRLRLRVVFEAGQIVIVQTNVELPYVPPVENLRATIDSANHRLNVNWDYGLAGTTFYVYKEVKETVSGESYYRYELAGTSTTNAFTINDYTVAEHARINGIAVNAVVGGKQSGLRRLEKSQFVGTLSNPSEITASYNVDTNELSLSWQHSEIGCVYKVYRKVGQSMDLLVTTSAKNVTIENFYGRVFWNTSEFVVAAEREGSLASASVPKSSVQIVNPQIPTSSSVMYKLFIRSFYDGSGNDGIGDFVGVTQKVNYLKDLGIDTIWFLPFNNSESYHGYDVTDYYDVEPDYGTYEDLENMIKVLNANGIRVVMDVVFNHTSDRHPWFLDAIENTTDSPYWNYYIMSLQDKTGQQKWHWKLNSRGQKVWYFGLFSHTMPDLNFDNQAVREELKRVLDFWITVGVDGFRFDAVKHFYGWDWNDGVAGSAAVSREFEAHIRGRLPHAIVVGEAYDGATSVLSQFAPMPVFNFAFMYDITGNYEGRDGLLGSSTNWVRTTTYHLPIRHFPFIDNHDLNRFVSVLIDQKYSGNYGSGIRQYLLTNALLLSLDGMPAIYYGNEIGLRGWKWSSDPWDMPVREPMQWYRTQSGPGQTWWTRPIYAAKNITQGNASVDGAIYDDPNDGVSVEEQESGTTVYNFFKQFINLRKTYPALALGALTIERDWKNLYVLKKVYGSQECLVLINLDPTYANSYTVPAGYRRVWQAFFNGTNFTFGPTNDNPLSSNTNWTVNPRQVYVFVK